MASANKAVAEAAGQRDELAESLAELFANVSVMVRGELQGTNNQLALLEKMNDRVAQEYSNYGDVAAGLRVFVEQLDEKKRGFDEYVSQIDAIDQQVTEFEAVVSMLDKHVALLEKKSKISLPHIFFYPMSPIKNSGSFTDTRAYPRNVYYILDQEITL